MDAREYRRLIQAFLDQHITAEEFKTRYFRAMKSEPGGMDRHLFLILEDLFEDADAYWIEWTQEDESPYRITEATLRKEAAMALDQLDQYLSHQQFSLDLEQPDE